MLSYVGVPKVSWTLRRTRHEIQIIGDSNLRSFFRIPTIHHSVAVHSYSGARAIHIHQICRQEVMHGMIQHHVRHVVINIGINHRCQRRTTSMHQVGKAMCQLKALFPAATIYWPLADIAPCLSDEQKQNLEDFNTTLRRAGRVERRLNLLPLLDPDLFHTDDEGVHWRRDTPLHQYQRFTRAFLD